MSERTRSGQQSVEVFRLLSDEVVLGLDERGYIDYMGRRLGQILTHSPRFKDMLAERFATISSRSNDLYVVQSSDGKVYKVSKMLSIAGASGLSLGLVVEKKRKRKTDKRLSLQLTDSSVIVRERSVIQEPTPKINNVYAPSIESDGVHVEHWGGRSVGDMRMVSIQMLRDFETALAEDERQAREAKAVPPNQVCV